MPPKRRTAPSTRTAPVPKPSKLGKAHHLTAALESEIRAAWSLFCAPLPSSSVTTTTSARPKPSTKPTATADTKNLSDTVIQTTDIRRVLIALNAPPSSGSELAEIVDALDPDREGTVGFEMFFAVAALKVRDRHEDDHSDDNEDDEDGNGGSEYGEDGGAYGDSDGARARKKGKGKGKGKGRVDERVRAATHAQDVRDAFGLFTRGEGEVITLAHLRRVARELREEVDDKLLRDMIREANGGIAADDDGDDNKQRGKVVVGLGEFEDVMRRAGVFG